MFIGPKELTPYAQASLLETLLHSFATGSTLQEVLDFQRCLELWSTDVRDLESGAETVCRLHQHAGPPPPITHNYDRTGFSLIIANCKCFFIVITSAFLVYMHMRKPTQTQQLKNEINSLPSNNTHMRHSLSISQ